MELGATETRLPSALAAGSDLTAFTPGTVLAGRYRIVSMLGRGGMGEVYRADDLRLNQPVALKFLPAFLERDRTARERLLAEARNARTVSHPNVCRVYDVGEVHGRYFLTMEYIDGEDLASLLRRVGRLSAPKALEIARQLLAGLAAAHDRGLLHRDLKPANVMVDGQGRARITDFGLSIQLADGREPARSGQAGGAAHGVVELAGTVAYMAPEQFGGQPATVQSDFYALGLILYEACTGQAALHSTTIEGWKQAHSGATPTAPSAIVTEIDRALERAILWCLEKDPARRPTSAAKLAAALPGGDPLTAMMAAGETPSPELVAASGEEGTLPRGQAWAMFVAAIVALVLVVITLGSVALNNAVPMRSPDAQLDTARLLLTSVGHAAAARDSIWWMRADRAYLDDLPTRGTTGTLFGLPAQDVPGPVRFCYRQSPRPIFSTAFPYPTPDEFLYTEPEPAMRWPGEAFVELDSSGRLVQLRILPGQQPSAATAIPDWDLLLRAARCEPLRLSRTTPSLLPPDRYDVAAEWTGDCHGRQVHVSAAAVGGGVTWFQVRSSRTSQAAPPADKGGSISRLWVVQAGLFVLPMILLGILAWRNVTAGRGDRRGARRLAAVMFGAYLLCAVGYRHWPQDLALLLPAVVALFAPAGFSSTVVWLFYLGLEPVVRRRWPQLLVGWTRLLDGRWRDPLVGRAVLSGLVYALVLLVLVTTPLIVARWLDWTHMGPAYRPYVLNPGGFWAAYVADGVFTGISMALVTVATLVIARWLLPSNAAALAGWALALVVMTTWTGVNSGAPVAVALSAGVLSAAFMAFVLMRAGMLGYAAAYMTFLALDAGVPWTLDPSRWYFYRGALAALVVVGLAFWAFTTALGRQSMFPAQE